MHMFIDRILSLVPRAYAVSLKVHTIFSSFVLDTMPQGTGIFQISTLDLLFGKENEPVPENESLFLQGQAFINSRRFVDSP